MQKNHKIFIYTLPIAQARMSYIGHLVLELTDQTFRRKLIKKGQEPVAQFSLEYATLLLHKFKLETQK